MSRFFEVAYWTLFAPFFGNLAYLSDFTHLQTRPIIYNISGPASVHVIVFLAFNQNKNYYF